MILYDDDAIQKQSGRQMCPDMGRLDKRSSSVQVIYISPNRIPNRCIYLNEMIVESQVIGLSHIP